MDKKMINTALKGYFLAVGVLMYYFLTESLSFGLVISFRHVFALVLFASAFCCFLFRPNIARSVVLVKDSFIYCLPLAVMFVVSLFIWFVDQAETAIIARGLSGWLVFANMLSSTLAAAAFLYIFGERGIWFNLIVILLANFMMVFTIIAQNGIGTFFSEFMTLILTFAGTTGDVIVQAEIHELAFCLGAYLVYMLLKPKRDWIFWILASLSMFCFLAAFKRIAVIAIAVALAIGWLLRFIAKFKRSAAKNLAVIFSVIIALVLIGYIAIIKMDVFTLMEKAGISTSGRSDVYRTVNRFYEFSPAYLGRGIGFLTYQLTTEMHIGVATVHNDFLQFFIDLGFWGYILWLLSITLLRILYFGAGGKVDRAVIVLALTIYLVIVSSTDNTMNYPLLTTVLAILMIGYGFDESVRKNEKKLFGVITSDNLERRGDTLL